MVEMVEKAAMPFCSAVSMVQPAYCVCVWGGGIVGRAYSMGGVLIMKWTPLWSVSAIPPLSPCPLGYKALG